VEGLFRRPARFFCGTSHSTFWDCDSYVPGSLFCTCAADCLSPSVLSHLPLWAHAHVTPPPRCVCAARLAFSGYARRHTIRTAFYAYTCGPCAAGRNSDRTVPYNTRRYCTAAVAFPRPRLGVHFTFPHLHYAFSLRCFPPLCYPCALQRFTHYCCRSNFSIRWRCTLLPLVVLSPFTPLLQPTLLRYWDAVNAVTRTCLLPARSWWAALRGMVRDGRRSFYTLFWFTLP